MAVALKTQNTPILLGVVVANAAIFWLVADLPEPTFRDWYAAIPAGATFALGILLEGLISSQWKYRLVYWRYSQPKPGYSAFTVHAHNDDRVILSTLENKIGYLPDDPHDQNYQFNGLLHEVQDKPQIRQSYGRFLLTRDWAFLSILMLLCVLVAALFWISDPELIGIYALALVSQYIIVVFAARNYGIQTVQNVLALHSRP